MKPNDLPRQVTFRYKNYRGEVAVRRVLPHSVSFKETPWHPEPQWLLHGLDLDKGEVRDFAMKDISEWKEL